MTIRRSTSMDRMWKDWRSTFPDTETAQDGWIGDLAHASGVSGHNPDDTPGVTAERQDADSEQEVRGVDKDARLNHPKVNLEMVIQRMLRTPADLTRLIYIIYRGRIWKKSNGWKEEPYGGEFHGLHGHFSGDPASDENGAEWKSITSFKENVMTDFSNTDTNAWRQALRVKAVMDNSASMVDGSVTEPNGLASKLAGIASQASSNGSGISELKIAVAALATGGVTQEMVTAAMVAALQDPAVLAALAPVMAEQAFQGSQRAEQE